VKAGGRYYRHAARQRVANPETLGGSFIDQQQVNGVVAHGRRWQFIRRSSAGSRCSRSAGHPSWASPARTRRTVPDRGRGTQRSRSSAASGGPAC